MSYYVLSVPAVVAKGLVSKRGRVKIAAPYWAMLEEAWGLIAILEPYRLDNSGEGLTVVYEAFGPDAKDYLRAATMPLAASRMTLDCDSALRIDFDKAGDDLIESVGICSLGDGGWVTPSGNLFASAKAALRNHIATKFGLRDQKSFLVLSGVMLMGNIMLLEKQHA